MKRLIILVLLVSLVTPFALAEQKHITVLSVSEGNTTRGSIADIYLEVRPGTGAVYIDSFPLTKLDTQLSARFAREYACQLSDTDCSRLDFFFVVRASSTIIGGPSAGGAMGVLSYATLEDLDLREDTVMTGTINSGGIIGPVGGTSAKVEAAAERGFSRVLVPSLEYDGDLDGLGVDVIPVDDVEEAIWYFTGVDVRPEHRELVVPDEYTQVMEGVADNLCARAGRLSEQVNASAAAKDFLSLAATASAQQHFYTAASYCFSASLNLREGLLANHSQQDLRRIYRTLEHDIELFDQSLPDDLDGISDLEVYMIVRERLVDASDRLSDEQYDNLSSSGIAYALERFSSAQAWSVFFGVFPDRPLDVSEAQLAASCRQKLAEAEERVNYITYLIAIPLDGTRQDLVSAYEYQRQGEWALCLFSASKTKAEADSVISAVYAGEDINRSVDVKLAKAEQVIAGSLSHGSFPLLGYSYLEYARDLENPYSANLYAEYAFELSQLDIYFPAKGSSFAVDASRLWLLLSGVVVGFTAGVLFWELWTRERRKPRKKARR